MILQGSLLLKYKGESYSLIVKTFLKNNTYYFYISDKEKEHRILAGETLELTYADSFCAVEKEVEENKNVCHEVVSAIQDMLLENKSLWYY